VFFLPIQAGTQSISARSNLIRRLAFMQLLLAASLRTVGELSSVSLTSILLFLLFRLSRFLCRLAYSACLPSSTLRAAVRVPSSHILIRDEAPDLRDPLKRVHHSRSDGGAGVPLSRLQGQLHHALHVRRPSDFNVPAAAGPRDEVSPSLAVRDK
jgi:hypothetical protein